MRRNDVPHPQTNHNRIGWTRIVPYASAIWELSETLWSSWHFQMRNINPIKSSHGATLGYIQSRRMLLSWVLHSILIIWKQRSIVATWSQRSWWWIYPPISAGIWISYWDKCIRDFFHSLSFKAIRLSMINDCNLKFHGIQWKFRQNDRKRDSEVHDVLCRR